jgi:hypothetical protein
MATGHSLEHPAAAAVPQLGDFVQGEGARPPAEWGRYMRHGDSPTGPERVIRAVYLSDTNPPGYYLLLSAWTRLFGTTDAALRLFSVVVALAAMPLLWILARHLGGTRAAFYACLIYAVVPAGSYYAAEGRMYALTWPLGLALAWASASLRRGATPGRLITWSIAGAAGLLAHYFFAFVWLACASWLLLWPARVARRRVLVAAISSLFLVIPWAVQVPATLEHWRVTSGWLEVPLTLPQALWSPIELTRSSFAARGVWGGTKPFDRLVTMVFVGVAILLLQKGLRPLFTRRRRLAWFWLTASVLGILVFDALRGSSAALEARYALPGLPAAVLLAGLTIARLPKPLASGAITLMLVGWSTAYLAMFSGHSRPWQPFSHITARVESELSPGDALIVQSIPSGVLAFARYMEREIPFTAWVEQLGERRVPEDLERFTAGACRAALVKVHTVRAQSPAEEWLRAHALLYDSEHMVDTRGEPLHEILFFRLNPDADTRARRCPERLGAAPTGPDAPAPSGQHSGARRR